MQRRGFRYLLPIVLTALYVSLIHSGCSHEQKYYQAVERAKAEVEKQQAIGGREKDEISFYDLPHSPPRGIQLALGINLPAGLTAIPFLLLLPRSHPLAAYWVIGVFVPFLWLLVGRWIDRRIGWLPPKQIKSGSDLKASVFGLCGAIAATLGGVFFVGLIFGVFHHGLVVPVALAF
jgi:hypothetical protein